jgi:hypothetical protein
VRITIATEADLHAVRELLINAAFRDATVQVLKQQLVFTCEVIRAVPEKAEEYWSGPLHKTRIPWTHCQIEFSGITQCHMRELDEASFEGECILEWERKGGQYHIHLQTPMRLEFDISMKTLDGRCEDVGELNWHP